MKKYLNLIAFLFLHMHVHGQSPVQVFTPDASELGKYGQIPVNYFNGLPEISIPLTTFKAKGYDLPLYLTYHASGNNPDSHPGWVGLGWTLHAGGMINRIINGYKDEKSEKEFQRFSNLGFDSEFAYFYNAEQRQNADWADENRLSRLSGSTASERPFDTEPDEFQINIDDIQASFYITGENKIKIKSKSNMNFKADIRLNTSNSIYILFKNRNLDKKNLEASLFTYIEEIIITKDNGVKYYFGGNKDAIEFSFIQNPKYSEIGTNTNEWRVVGTANSWLLRKIKLLNGEIITFNYEKRGTPIIISDNHYGTSYIIDDNGVGSLFDTKNQPGYNINLSFVFIQPSYLTSIKSEVTNNEIFFGRTKSNELGYNINLNDFNFRVGNFEYYDPNTPMEFSFSNLMTHSYYMQLYEIVEKDRKIKLELSNDSQSRLKLLSVAFYNKNNITDTRINGYKFEYNDVNLPPYNSKKTDKWGYYNNKYYGDKEYQNLSAYRTPEEYYMKAEILRKIVYPTGGYSEFFYEPHRYSKVAEQFPFSTQSATGIAGGLRIKEIINSDNNKTVSRKFEYVDNQGNSSGILSGNQIYYIVGRHHVDFCYGRWWGLTHMDVNIKYDARYYIMQENNINQLSTTNGSHVTYSRIVEKMSDGSKTIYNYSNHDEFMDELPEKTLDNINEKVLSNSFTSRELERGLLTRTEFIDTKGRIVKTEEYAYNSTPERYNDFVKSANQTQHCNGMILRMSAIRIYTFCPYLLSKTTTINDIEGMEPITTTTKFEYNGYKLLTKATSCNSKNEEEIDITRYSGDISNGVYLQMQNKNILSYPVEKIQIRNQHLTGSELFTYKKNTWNDDYVLDKRYKSRLNSPVSYRNFVNFDGNIKDSHYDSPEMEYTRYDRYSNIEESISKDFHKSTYIWGYNGLYPVAIFENARNNYKVTAQYEDAWEREWIALKYNPLHENVKSYEFQTSKSGNIELSLPGALGYNWYITGRLDNNQVDLVQLRSSVDAGLPWNNYKNVYKGNATFYAAAGYHTLRIDASDVFKGPTAGNENGNLILSYWKSTSIPPEITGNDDVFYNNFENASNVVPFGFHSSQSYAGPYTVSLVSNPSKNYIIDYQVFKDGKWNYTRHDFENGTYTIDESDRPIDDIRVYPRDATATSFSHIPFVGLRSSTNERGITESYKYDALGRLVSVRDNDQNIVKKFDYNYYNQLPPVDTDSYFNIQLKKSFTRNNCNLSSGEIGKPIDYTVRAGKYSSSISQEDANKKAYDDLMNNGQQYANENGECESHIIVSVYNPDPATYILNYTWGVQGSITTDYYEVPPSPQIANTGDILEDFKPVILYIPRKNYRTVSMFIQGAPKYQVDFSIKSTPHHFDVFYDIYHYPAHEDIYVIGEYSFSH